MLLRAAVEGEAVETIGEMRDRVLAGLEKESDPLADETASTSFRSKTEKETGSGNRFVFGLGTEGAAQATSLGVELASVLAGWHIGHANFVFPDSSKPCEQTANLIAKQLRDATSLGERVITCTTAATKACLATPEDGDLLLGAASIKRFARNAWPPPRHILIAVANDTSLLERAAEIMSNAPTDAGNNVKNTVPYCAVKTFEHGNGVLLEYPRKESEDSDARWTLVRTLSHE